MSHSEPPLDFLCSNFRPLASSLKIYIIQVLESSGMIVGERRASARLRRADLGVPRTVNLRHVPIVERLVEGVCVSKHICHIRHLLGHVPLIERLVRVLSISPVDLRKLFFNIFY